MSQPTTRAFKATFTVCVNNSEGCDDDEEEKNKKEASKIVINRSKFNLNAFTSSLRLQN